MKNIKTASNVLEIVMIDESNNEFENSRLLDLITEEINMNRNRYEQQPYIMVLVKTEPGPVSLETVSIGITPLDGEFSAYENSDDDLYSGAAYYYGEKTAIEFSRMGFPMFAPNRTGVSDDYLGLLGTAFVYKTGGDLKVVFQNYSIRNDNGFMPAGMVLYPEEMVFGNEITKAYDIPAWTYEYAVGMRNAVITINF